MHIDNAPLYYFTTNEEGFLLDVNDTLCKQLNYTKEELAGKSIQFIFTIASRIFYQTHLSLLLKLQENVSEIFISLQSRDRQAIPVLCNAKRFTEQENVIHLFAGILVENRKKFEDELIEARKTAESALHENTALIAAKKELEHSIKQFDTQLHLVQQQNHELKQFNHVVTHELQEPIRKISVFSDLLADVSLKTGGEEKKYIDKLMRAAAQIRSVVKGLQQYAWLARRNSDKFSRVDLNEILVQTREDLMKEYPGVPLKMNMELLPVIEADAEQIKLLFYHILSNTIRYRKKEESPVVHIDSVVIQQNQFQHTAGKYKYADYLKIEIRDEGIGFASEYKEKVFDLFKKLHNADGNGLGLSLSKKIAENHLGKITADSKEGEGTIIRLLLPVKNILQEA